MRTIISKALAAKFQGVDAKIIDSVAAKLAKTVSTEAQATAAADAVTFQQLLETYGESRATEASQTAIANYERKHGLKDGKQEKSEGGSEEAKEPEGESKGDTAGELAAAIKSLRAELDGLKQTRVDEAHATRFAELISSLPDSYKTAYSRTRTKGLSEEEFTKLVESITPEVEAIKAEANSKGVVLGRPMNHEQTNPQTQAQASEAETDAVVKRLNL